MREKADYRDNLEYLEQMMPGETMLTVSMISRSFRISRDTVRKQFPFKGKYITKPSLARMMCQ